nr:hypothetical protein [uncultured Sphingobacterium sp.]
MIKNLIEKLNSVLKFSKENFKSSNIKGTDTAVEYAENAEGIDVLIASANGSETAPNGVIELDNGDSFEVVDGKIAKVITTEKADEAKEDEKTEELADEKKEDKAEDEKVEIIIADAKEDEAKAPETKEDEKAKALEDEIEKLKAELKNLKGEFSAIPTKADLENFKTEFLKVLKAIPAPEAFAKGTEVNEKETIWRGFNRK